MTEIASNFSGNNGAAFFDAGDTLHLATGNSLVSTGNTGIALTNGAYDLTVDGLVSAGTFGFSAAINLYATASGLITIGQTGVARGSIGVLLGSSSTLVNEGSVIGAV